MRRAALVAAHTPYFLLVAIALVLLGLAAVNVAGPAMHRPLVSLVGASMEPTIPRGALVMIEPVSPAQLRVGDVVTIREPNGVLVTHRVTRIASVSAVTYVETKGDANHVPDPVLTPATAVLGRALVWIPGAGYLEWLISHPSGWMTIGGALVLLLVAGLLLEGGPRNVTAPATAEL
jgi:signal peptidase I